jgi:hypothetical protein
MGVEGVDDLVAEVVADGGEAMRGIPGVARLLPSGSVTRVSLAGGVVGVWW